MCTHNNSRGPPIQLCYGLSDIAYSPSFSAPVGRAAWGIVGYVSRFVIVETASSVADDDRQYSQHKRNLSSTLHLYQQWINFAVSIYLDIYTQPMNPLFWVSGWTQCKILTALNSNEFALSMITQLWRLCKCRICTIVDSNFVNHNTGLWLEPKLPLMQLW